MATLGTTVINELSRRIRDPNNLAWDRVNLTTLVEKCQQILNDRLALVTSENNFTLTPYQQIYPNFLGESATFSTISRVIGVHDNERELEKVDWQTLHHYDHNWIRRIGPEPQVWSPLGRDALLVHPGIAEARTIQIMGCVKCTLPNESLAMTIPDQYLPALINMLEAQLLAAGRELDDRFKTVYDSGLGRMKAYGEERRVRPGKPPLEQSSGPNYE